LKNKPVKYQLKVDLQCSACGALTHQAGEALPRFCPCCGAAMERFCLRCQKRADMYFEEWWPQEDECVRTYVPAKRCSQCNAMLEKPHEGPHLHS
jgi:predicted RNA-binding Zn-ribbon protein involved in translation (DUF1610 family)